TAVGGGGERRAAAVAVGEAGLAGVRAGARDARRVGVGHERRAAGRAGATVEGVRLQVGARVVALVRRAGRTAPRALVGAVHHGAEGHRRRADVAASAAVGGGAGVDAPALARDLAAAAAPVVRRRRG